MATPWHVDLHFEAADGADPVAAGLFTGPGLQLLTSGAGPYTVRRITVTSDTAQRVLVGVKDAQNQRSRAVRIPAGGGADMLVCTPFPGNQTLNLWHSVAGSLDVAVEGTYD